LKTNIKTLAEELDLGVDAILKAAAEKVKSGVTGTGARTWFDDAAVAILREALADPILSPKKLSGRVRRLARNPSWCYVAIDGMASLVPVAVPRRLAGRLLGKVIPIEMIIDGSNESTYRYDYAPR
jgi:hypothetical protein